MNSIMQKSAAAALLFGACSTQAADISGQIMLDDQRLFNATIELIQADDVVATATFPSFGVYEFTDVPAGTYNVRVTTDEVTNETSTIIVDDTDIGHNIWLFSVQPELEVFTFDGQVVDYSGNLYPNSYITLTNIENFSRYEAQSDDEGNFTMEVPAGDYMVRLRFNANIDGDDDGFTDGYISLYLDNILSGVTVSEALTQNFVVPVKNIDINATLADEEVRTRTDVSVTNSGTNEANQRGFYESSSIYLYDTTKPGRMFVEREVGFLLEPLDAPTANGPFTTPVEPLTLVANDTTAVVTQPLLDKGIIYSVNSFTDLDGNTLSDICVRLEDTNLGLSTSRCNLDNENNEMYVAPGTYNVSLFANFPFWLEQSVSAYFSFGNYQELELQLVDDEVTEVTSDFVFPVYLLSGNVQDGDANLIENAVIRLDNTDEVKDYGNGNSGYVSLFNNGGPTDASGNFSLWVSPFADYINATPPVDSGLAFTRVSMSDAVQGELLTIVLPDEGDPIEPPDTVALSGAITNITGDPVSASVTVYDENFNYVNRTDTSDEGLYAIDVPDQGNYSLQIFNRVYKRPPTASRNNSFSTQTNSISVDGPTEFDVILPLLSLQGRAMDVEGNPIPGFQFYLRSPSQPGQMFNWASGEFPGVSKPDGSFVSSFWATSRNFNAQGMSLPEYNENIWATSVERNETIDLIVMDTVTLTDEDTDGIPDYYVELEGVTDASSDQDGDTLTALEEFNQGSDINDSDTDGDTLLDTEDAFPALPSYAHPIDDSIDSDSDGFTDVEEILAGTDPQDENDFPILLADLSVSDINLQTCIDERIAQSGAQNVEQFTFLNCQNREVATLEGLEQFTGLRQLYLSNNEFSDLTPLSGLLALSDLTIRDTQVTDISALANLPSLSYLDMWELALDDISVLSSIPSLERLIISNLVEDDSETLAQLDLSMIWLSFSTLTDLDFLDSYTALTSLTFFEVEGLSQQEIDRVGEFTGLTYLEFVLIELDNIEFLESLTNLTYLRLENNGGVGSLEPLRSLTNLTGLTLAYNNVESIEFVSSLQNMRNLYLYGNNISDISPLEELDNLTNLNLSNNQISDISPLAGFDGNQLFLDNNQISDLSPLATARYSQILIFNNPDIACVDTSTYAFYSRLPDDCDIAPPPPTAEIQGMVVELYDMTGDGAKEYGVLYSDSDNGNAPTLGMYNSEESSDLIDTLVWSPIYSHFELKLMPDMNTDDIGELALFGLRNDEGNVGRAQMVVVDPMTGDVLRTYNWPASWDEVSPLLLDDMTGDGVDEVAIQGLNSSNGRPQLVVRNGATGGAVETFSFPDLFSNGQWIQLSDVTGDGVDDIGLVGNRRGNGKMQVRVVDATDRTNRPRSYNFGPKWDDTQFVRLSDTDGEGTDDWGMYGVRQDDGRPQLINKKGHEARGVLRIHAWPGDMSNATFHRMPDMTGDGIDDVAVVGLRSNNRYQFNIKDGADRSGSVANLGWPNNWDEVSFEVMDDLTGDDIVEVALFGQNRATGQWELVVKDGSTRLEVHRYSLGDGWDEKPQVMMLGDVSGDNVPDFLVYGSEDDAVSVQRYSGAETSAL